MSRRVPGSLAARALVVAVAALVAMTVGLPAPALAATATIRITDTVTPRDLEVVVGTTVTWVNESGNRHKIRSTSGPTDFEGDLDAGESFSITFDVTGTWQYVDDRDRDLSQYWGTVTVTRSATPTPKPTPTPPPGATPAPTQAPPPGDILMAGRVFDPRSLTVDAGTTVRWRNNDDRDHTVTANDRSFDSGVMGGGATYSKTFTMPGTYAYICAIHPDMTGTIAVRGTGGATPPPPKPTPTPAPTTPPATPAPGSSTVAVADFAFSPTPIDVIAGTTITWINNGAALHTVTASDSSFDSGLMAAGGGRYSRRFPTPGTFPYLCTLHPAMTGVVRVSGAGGATPPPAASPTPSPTPPPVNGARELRDFAFVPSSIRVTPGTTVTWVNTGAAPHTVTDRAGAFDSGLLARGTRWSRTFSTAGTFELLCTIHPQMTATLVVAAPGATPPPAATPAPVRTPPPGSGEVAILDFDYAPATLEVANGATVRWVNRGVAPHTVTASDGSFDSGFLQTGDAWSRQFTTPGTYEYLCTIHPAMTGRVVVATGTGGTTAGASQGTDGAGGVPAGAASPATDPGTAVAAGGPGDPSSAGSGSGGGAPGALVDAAAEPMTPEAYARLGLVVLLGVAAVAVFGGLIRSTVRAGR